MLRDKPLDCSENGVKQLDDLNSSGRRIGIVSLQDLFVAFETLTITIERSSYEVIMWTCFTRNARHIPQIYLNFKKIPNLRCFELIDLMKHFLFNSYGSLGFRSQSRLNYDIADKPICVTRWSLLRRAYNVSRHCFICGTDIYSEYYELSGISMRCMVY